MTIRSDSKSLPTKSHLKSWLVRLRLTCENDPVLIYGPYPPSKGRTRWRIQVYDPTTQRKSSLTANSRAQALELRSKLEKEVKALRPLGAHEAIDAFVDYKRSVIANPQQVEQLGQKLKQLIPDVPVLSITPKLAEEYYLAETQRVGKFGVIKPATHHARLRLAKELWSFLVRREMATSNPFESVEPVGRANAGKPQPREADAKRLDAYLFEQAGLRDEGALAILVQLYLGLRPSEVLGLTVGACEGTVIYVAGTKTKNAKRKLELFRPVADLVAVHCKGRLPTERLFAANLPKQPSPNWMYKRVHRVCNELGIPKFCPHALRGLHASFAVAAGATTHSVAKALGHASFSTTARHYASPDSIAVGRSKQFAAAMHDEGLLEQLSPQLRALVLDELARRK